MDKKCYSCLDCDKVFETATGLWKHKKNKHTEPEIIINENSICKYCKKVFFDRKSRWRHEKKYCKVKFNNIINQDQNTIIKNRVKLTPNNITSTEHNYIYLIKKYDLNYSEHIYKFGKSTRPIIDRLTEHGREAVVILILKVDNCHLIEEKMLNLLRNDNKIKHRKNIGLEYFNCDDEDYITDIILDNYKKYRCDDIESNDNNSNSDENPISLNILSYTNNII